jgi:addiction module HigA family antidote
VTEAASALGVTRPALSAFLNGRADLSPDMALRVEKAFGVRMDTLMRMQNSYDIAQARSRESEIKVARYKPKRCDRYVRATSSSSPLRGGRRPSARPAK